MSLVLQDQLVLSPATADHLQEEIDAIEAGSDVTDVVGTYADLEDYDTSKLTDNDIIKVLQDETQDNAQTYYRWSTSAREFTYVGKVESKTYTAGNGIDITNDTISVTDPVLVNKATGTDSVGIKGVSAGNYQVIIGNGAQGGNRNGSVIIGDSTGSTTYSSTNSVFIGRSAGPDANINCSVGIGPNARTSADGTIQLSASVSSVINSDANTFKVANRNGNFEIMSADGTIPEARLADTTSATAGQVLQLDSNSNAIWADVDSLPDQTSQAGKILGTDGTNAAWETKTTVSFRTWGANE